MVDAIRIDLGCGPNKKEGFVGLDQYEFPGVDHVLNVGQDRWPFDDGSVDEAFSSHFVEHLTATQRVHFYNELHRVLKPGGTAQIIVPHWGSCRAYGDPTHQWPPVSEFSLYYLDKDWRASNAPHTDKKWNPEGFDCDFSATWGYGMHQALLSRNVEYQQYALSWFKEAASDLHVNVVKK